MQETKQEVTKVVTLSDNGKKSTKCNKSPKKKKYLACWVKVSADNILKYFSYFSEKIGFDIPCKLCSYEKMCLEFQILFSGKTRKISSFCHLLNLSLAWYVLTLKAPITTAAENSFTFIYFFSENKVLTFHVNHLPSRNVKTYFL